MNEYHNDKRTVCELAKISASRYGELIAKGVIKDSDSLVEKLSSMLVYFKEQRDIKEQKIRLEERGLDIKEQYVSSMTNVSYDDTMHPIIKAEKIQKIRLDKAKEYEVWTKVKLNKEGIIEPFELKKILSPFVLVIKNKLNQLALSRPDIQPEIDSCLVALSDLGERAIESAKEDIDVWINEQALSGTIKDDVAESILMGV